MELENLLKARYDLKYANCIMKRRVRSVLSRPVLLARYREASAPLYRTVYTC